MKLAKLLLPVLLLAACTTKVQEPVPPVTTSHDGLTLTVRLADDKLTDPLEVQVTVKNEGAQPAIWHGSSSCKDVTRVVAKLPDGREGQLNPVWPDGSAEPRICTADYVQHELKPGEALESHWRWDGKVAENPQTPQYREVAAPKGKVSIVASFPIADDKWMDAVLNVTR